ncbi:hypothetical protein S7335_5131 [Synechococcus sp. PCC 7335]|uniref:hypothetical protein n=1 Tax=Synechococcus sp. (strain ATCC 29403 / PCC 7335) TaxID=91464 RepID=UPI00017ED9B2|nr:hypothetical protein [Synechococcus sp. PCC 7335]EDX87421.1 hypothetical protein S7335_5131 [Synechococcus sp. PCC 7335]
MLSPTSPSSEFTDCQLGKVVKSNSHCDYVVQLDTSNDVDSPPQIEDYGFGQFVKFESSRHWAVGIIYDSQLFNSSFLSSGPRLTSAPDPVFTPDLIQDTCILLNVALVGSLQKGTTRTNYGLHGIPRVVIPANTPVSQMSIDEIHNFHRSADGRPQFSYYGHLLRSGGAFAPQLTQQVLSELIATELFSGAEQKALQVLRKEMAWKSAMSAMRSS